MRKVLLPVAAAAAIAGTLSFPPAQAMTVGTAAGVQAAVEETDVVQDVVTVCRHRSLEQCPLLLVAAGLSFPPLALASPSLVERASI